jgi:hypothetical protein
LPQAGRRTRQQRNLTNPQLRFHADRCDVAALFCPK